MWELLKGTVSMEIPSFCEKFAMIFLPKFLGQVLKRGGNSVTV
ncbi:hypothetical protein LEP1GSC137_0043 [Leptospira borgpetersenii str. Noumea 25]|uniref:Uncharacterized protein n=1 Tax=Leptospira borgpetersenii serovar Ballum TaxID=280505 RepID=A0A0S2IQG9_LEPBO|nr:hypothetical protein LBBP_01615 [Leptospira borgpetersenii serovar Ballum]EKQ90407.1 hypothetical protein LEP1GSC101_2405 [Leptospira borgpetersenii str. UI 09149]EMK08749.1 hypothetical protein LEP1GSC066_4012 [Leptospira sp. serovar Kenya str. Sh9]EMN58531.1 hypothetical protein LEP1GSC090_0293 [Leptospira borgpetersenii serovar Javanica str. MK146]EMO07934.1 hypothetical protein LEP1GSC137_0043 [Leptospira borgpetersenii str. Noumea 25]